MCSVELLQLLVRDEENDVPRAHPHPGRDETFVQRSEAFVAHRLHGTVDAAGVIQTGGGGRRGGGGGCRRCNARL